VEADFARLRRAQCVLVRIERAEAREVLAWVTAERDPVGDAHYSSPVIQMSQPHWNGRVAGEVIEARLPMIRVSPYQAWGPADVLGVSRKHVLSDASRAPPGGTIHAPNRGEVMTLAPLPESVRRQILFQHEVLRALLGRLVDAADRILRGEPAMQDLRDAQRTLHDVLEIHVRQEEEILAPLLRAQWGPERLARMYADHRKALDALQRQRTRKPNEAAAASHPLVLRMLAAMAAEERDMLGVSTTPVSGPPAQFPIGC
jgi:Hemerythrin HHE cation binding domain